MATMSSIQTVVKQTLTRNGHGKLTGLQDLIDHHINSAILELAMMFPSAPDWRGTEDVVVSASSKVVTLTEVWLAIEAVFDVTNDRPLLERRRPEVEAMHGQQLGEGEPVYYSEMSNTALQIEPAPNVATTIQIQGWKLPTAKDTSTQPSEAPDIGQLWHTYVTDFAVAWMSMQAKDPDLTNAYLAKAERVKLAFGKRARRFLTEQRGVIQTLTEHMTQHRVRRRTLRD